MSDIRQRIVKALITTKLGLTTREIAEDLKMKVQVVNGSLGQMAQSGFIDRGEYIEGEGQIWLVTDLGIETYGTKSDLEVKTNVPVEPESPLTQTEKTPVETVEAAPIVEESPLEQISEPVVEESLTTETEVVSDEPATNEVVSDISSKPINKIEYGTFEVFQLTDKLASNFIELMQSKQAKPIDNMDYKIATLESLAEIYNPKISATLREIAADLRA